MTRLWWLTHGKDSPSKLDPAFSYSPRHQASRTLLLLENAEWRDQKQRGETREKRRARKLLYNYPSNMYFLYTINCKDENDLGLYWFLSQTEASSATTTTTIDIIEMLLHRGGQWDVLSRLYESLSGAASSWSSSLALALITYMYGGFNAICDMPPARLPPDMKCY